MEHAIDDIWERIREMQQALPNGPRLSGQQMVMLRLVVDWIKVQPVSVLPRPSTGGERSEDVNGR